MAEHRIAPVLGEDVEKAYLSQITDLLDRIAYKDAIIKKLKATLESLKDESR